MTDAEHIYLDSDELEHVGSRNVEQELTQVNRLRWQNRRFSIFNQGYLEIAGRKSGYACDSYWLNLAFVDPVPARERYVDKLSLRIAAGSGLLAVLLSALSLLLPLQHTAWLAVLGLCAMLALGALWVAACRSYDKLVFHTRHGRARVIELFQRKPGRAEFDRFVTELRRRMRQSMSRYKGHRTHYLRDEMKEHRRLFEHGVLSDEAFEQAKTRVLRAHG